MYLQFVYYSLLKFNTEFLSILAALEAGPPKYPSSASKATDWDRIVGDIAKEEVDEKPEGEAALNALFQKIYSQGSDEVKRAMNKSFVSILSTLVNSHIGMGIVLHSEALTQLKTACSGTLKICLNISYNSNKPTAFLNW